MGEGSVNQLLISSFVFIFSITTWGNTSTENFQLIGPDGKTFIAKLTGFDTYEAVVAPNGNFCESGGGGNMVTAWHPFNVSLEFGGDIYSLDGDNSIGFDKPNELGIIQKIYLETYIFSNLIDCKSAFSKATWAIPLDYKGPIQKTDLAQMKLSFVKGSPGGLHFSIDLILSFDFVKKNIKAYKLKSGLSDLYRQQMENDNWELVGSGTL